MLSLYGPEINDFLHAITNAGTFKIIAPPVDTFGYGVCHPVGFEHAWEVAQNSTAHESAGKYVQDLGPSIKEL
jgi:hypothetical protein